MSEMIRGNTRLEELRRMINGDRATPGEKEEFAKTLDLYTRESMGEKTWREHPDWYEETEKLRTENEAKRRDQCRPLKK